MTKTREDLFDRGYDEEERRRNSIAFIIFIIIIFLGTLYLSSDRRKPMYVPDEIDDPCIEYNC